MTLPEVVVDELRPHIGAVRRAEPVGGGCIANATQIVASGTTYFLKWSGREAGLTFEAEAAGLKVLREAGSSLIIPGVIAVQNVARLRPGFLLLEWVEPAPKDEQFWQRFGEGLAALHRHTAKGGRYGFDRDTFIGRIEQHNEWQASWPDFFRSNRLGAQISRARERGRWRKAWDGPADRLFARLGDLLPAAPPASVLHGDLWSGNVLATSGGRASLIDPAAYFGHGETDLALTELFGGFDRRFYDAYQAAWPLESGYAERREVYNLYHLINHLNHFGVGYDRSIEQTLRRFS